MAAKYLARHWYRNPDDRRANFDAERESHEVAFDATTCLPVVAVCTTCTEGWHGGEHARVSQTWARIEADWAPGRPALEMPGGAG